MAPHRAQRTGTGGAFHRSSGEWAARAALAAFVLMVGYLGTAQALAHVFRNDAARAYAISPWNGRITALFARQLSGQDATKTDRRRADQIARQALRQDPTAVAAVATLGLDAQLRGDAPGARRLFAYAEHLSRRDLPTQFWAIEDAVGRSDVGGALRHYDIALRTSAKTPALLYPILASAITDPEVRVALLRVLTARPGWGNSFVNYVAGNSKDARATVGLFDGLRRAGVLVAPEASAVAINALILGNQWDAAWSYYASIRPGAKRSRSRDPRFLGALTAPSPFDWTPTNEPGIITSIQQGNRSGAFVFAVPSGVGGLLLQQVQVLSPGTYRLVGQSSDINQPETSRPYWVLSCRNGRELGRLPVPVAAQATGHFEGLFRVPAECPVQVLALFAPPSDEVSGTTGQIDVVQLSSATIGRVS